MIYVLAILLFSCTSILHCRSPCGTLEVNNQQPVTLYVNSKANISFVLRSRCGNLPSMLAKVRHFIQVERMDWNNQPAVICTFVITESGQCEESEGCLCRASEASIDFTVTRTADESLNGTWQVSSSNIADVSSTQFEVVVLSSKSALKNINQQTFYTVEGRDLSIKIVINSTRKPACSALYRFSNLTVDNLQSKEEVDCQHVMDHKLYCNNVAIPTAAPWSLAVRLPGTVEYLQGQWRLVLSLSEGFCVNKDFNIEYIKESYSLSIQVIDSALTTNSAQEVQDKGKNSKETDNKNIDFSPMLGLIGLPFLIIVILLVIVLIVQLVIFKQSCISSGQPRLVSCFHRRRSESDIVFMRQLPYPGRSPVQDLPSPLDINYEVHKQTDNVYYEIPDIAENAKESSLDYINKTTHQSDSTLYASSGDTSLDSHQSLNAEILLTHLELLRGNVTPTVTSAESSLTRTSSNLENEICPSDMSDQEQCLFTVASASEDIYLHAIASPEEKTTTDAVLSALSENQYVNSTYRTVQSHSQNIAKGSQGLLKSLINSPLLSSTDVKQ